MEGGADSLRKEILNVTIEGLFEFFKSIERETSFFAGSTVSKEAKKPVSTTAENAPEDKKIILDSKYQIGKSAVTLPDSESAIDCIVIYENGARYPVRQGNSINLVVEDDKFQGTLTTDTILVKPKTSLNQIIDILCQEENKNLLRMTRDVKEEKEDIADLIKNYCQRKNIDFISKFVKSKETPVTTHAKPLKFALLEEEKEEEGCCAVF